MTALDLMDTLGPALAQTVHVVAPLLNKIAPALGFAQDHPFVTGAAFLAGGGTAANLLARALNRIPVAALFSAMEVGAAAVSRVGNAGPLRVLYQPFEEFLVKVILGGARALAVGFTKDNATCPVIPGGQDQAQKEPAP